MARIEKLAYAEGASDIQFMENAGEAIASIVTGFCLVQSMHKEVTLLVGKGNNGGDAFAAGKRLLAEGFSVEAIHFYPYEACSPLCQKQHDAFKAAGGKIYLYKKDAPDFPILKGLLLDGLVGTGFHGKAEGELFEAIELANASGRPILAIDIPSGLNGNTGEVGSIAIHAVQTIYLGLPKLGFFLKEGWNHIGELRGADFGIDEKFLEEAKAAAFLIDREECVHALPKIERNRHKYQAGYIVAVAGSRGFSGAAFLSTKAALRTGAGIVRLFHHWDMESELAGAPLEIVKEPILENGLRRIREECMRAKCLMVGPGMGRTKESMKLFKSLLSYDKPMMVLDADALYFLAENPSWKIPEGAILTPHRGELERLLKVAKVPDEAALHTLCQEYVDKRKVTLVLKGGPTFIFHPGAAPLVCLRGDPGMATAGTGDVLTGIIAALVAQGVSSQYAATLGVLLHGITGEIVAHEKGSYSLIASDLIEALPLAFSELLS